MSAQYRSVRSVDLRPASGDERRHTDAEMVFALRRGEPWAAEGIWDRHSGAVHRFLMRALGRPSDEAEDLTQEVFLRVFSRAQLIREPAALREFVMSVAIRVLKWELRRRWVRRKVHLSDSGYLPDVGLNEGVNQEARQALGRCYAILDHLGSRERTAFVLRYFEEMTMDEVADGLGTSVSTAKRLVNRAVATVSERVGKDADLRTYFVTGDRGASLDGS